MQEKQRKVKQNRKRFETLSADDPIKQTIERALEVAQQSAFQMNGKTYVKGASLGKGNFVETFATNDPTRVLKHLHEDGIFLLFDGVLSYWEKSKTNLEKLKALGVSVAETEMGELFALQERVSLLESLSAEELSIESPLWLQLQKVFQLCAEHRLIIDLAKKNIGCTENPSDRKIKVFDFDAAREETDLPDRGFQLNLTSSARTYGDEVGKLLMPSTSSSSTNK